jgi:polyvinyl alcohol dehydrogenase (cytochrome)
MTQCCIGWPNLNVEPSFNTSCRLFGTGVDFMKKRTFLSGFLPLLMTSLMVSATGVTASSSATHLSKLIGKTIPYDSYYRQFDYSNFLLACCNDAGAPIETLPADPHAWPMYNHDAKGTRWNQVERALGLHNVASLRVQWVFSTQGAVAGTPAAVNDTVYAVDSSGNAYAVDRNGSKVWRSWINVPTLLGTKVTGSPLVTNRTVIFGDLAGFVHGLDVNTGAERWRTRPNSHPAAAIFGSPTMVQGYVAIGISSIEELFAGFPGYACCTFRGAVVLLDPADGHVIWQSFLIDEPHENSDGSFGPSGSAVWSTPTYDRASNTIYVSTGNNYSQPSTESSDAIIALNASNGQVRWINQRTDNDVSNVTYPPEDPNHPDFDFGDSPQIYNIAGRKVIGAGQKSGFFYAVDAHDGALVDEIQVSPGGGLGGLFSDSAVAENTVYANGVNWPFVYAGGAPHGGSLSAISGDGAAILWQFQTAMPNLSGVAVANHVVYFQSLDGFLYALDGGNGALLSRVQTGGQTGGPAISRGRIYLGTGEILNSLFNPFLVPGAGSIVALGAD